MSRPIDEKIVRMTLDNARFKQDVQSTLQSFNAINDATRKASSMDLSRMADGISQINRKFSAAGVIVGSVLNNLTTSAMKTGKAMYHAMVDPIIEGGKTRALNIEQAKFQFEGLGMDVDKTMASALEAVKGTAYGLDEAAVVAGQFGASGMKAGDEMTASLRGIAGVAAMTGSSYSDVGNIFTKVAGNGRLMGDDLLRLSARGVNAAAVLAKEFDMTEAAVREMVTAGEVSFDMFSQAMANAFGEHATRANETFTGSLSNLKAALGRIGAEFQSNKFEQYRRVINALTPKVDELAAAILPVTKAVNQLATELADYLIVAINKISFDKFIELGGIGNIVQGFWNIVKAGKRIISAVSKAFTNMFPPVTIEGLVKLTEGFKNLTSNMTMGTSTYNKVVTIFEGIFSVFSTVWEIAKVLGKALFGLVPDNLGGNALDVAVSVAEMAISFNEAVKEGNWLTDIIEGLGKGLGWVLGFLKDAALWVWNLAGNIKDTLGPAIEWIVDKLKALGKWIGEALSGLEFDDFLKGGVVLALGKVVLEVVKFMRKFSKNVDTFTSSFSTLFSNLGGALSSFQEQVKYKKLISIAIAVGILAVSIKMLEGIKGADIAKSIGALAGAMAILAGGITIIDKLDVTGSIRASINIIALSVAVGIMAIALKKISDMKPEELAVGMAGLVGITVTLVAAVGTLSSIGGKIGTSSLGLIALATSVTILASAVKKMSDIDTKDLGKSVTALGIIFLELAIFIKIVDGSKVNMGTGIAMLGVAAAIKIIVSAISDIADLDVPTLTKGLTTIGLILLAVAGFAAITGGGLSLMGTGAGLTLVAAGLALMVIPLKQFGDMEWMEIIKGLTMLSGALLAVSVAAVAASAGIPGAIAINMMAGAMILLLVPIKAFSKMSWGEIIKGIGGMALTLGVLAGVSMLLAPAVLPMMGMSVAIGLLGVAALAAGAGVLAFATGLGLLAELTGSAVKRIIQSLGQLIRGLGSLIPDIVKFVVDIGVALIVGLKDLIIPLIDAIHEITLAMLNAWNDNIDEYIEVGAEIVLSIINGIETYGPELIEAGYSMIVSLIEGMANTLENQGDRMVEAMSRLMKAVLLVVIKAGAQMVVDLLGWIPGVEEAMGKIVDSAESRLGNFEPDKIMSNKMSETGMAITESGKVVPLATERVGTLGMSVMERLDYMKTGQFLMDETESGITSKGSSVEQAAEGVSGQGILGLLKPDWASPGASSGDIYGDALAGKAPKAETSGSILGNAAHGALEKVKGFFLPTASASGADYSSGIEGTSGLASAAGTLIGNSANSAAGGIAFTPTGSSKGGEFSSGVSSTSGAASGSGSLIGNAARTGAEGISLSSAGSSRGGTFVTGVSSKHGAASTSGSGLSSSAKKGAEGTSLYTVGSNMGSGFVKGIGSWVKSAASKASELAGGAMAAIKKRTKQRSPSKETFWMGEYFGEGFGLGIESWGDKVVKTATNLAGGAMEAINKSLGLMPEEDYELTVRLVMDDSDLDWSRYDLNNVRVAPNLEYTNGLVSAASSQYGQNGNITKVTEDNSVENNVYEVNITTNSTHTRDDVRKLADRIQTELKNAKDRDKMGRGEAVIF